MKPCMNKECGAYAEKEQHNCRLHMQVIFCSKYQPEKKCCDNCKYYNLMENWFEYFCPIEKFNETWSLKKDYCSKWQKREETGHKMGTFAKELLKIAKEKSINYAGDLLRDEEVNILLDSINQ